MDNRPIGLLDSGVGGFTVVKKVIEKVPHESTVFIGDSANMPYGDKSHELKKPSRRITLKVYCAT